MSAQDRDQWYLEMVAGFEPYLSGSVEDAWARCLPIWRERGRIEDHPRGIRYSHYSPWWGKFLACEFSGKFRDDYPFLVRLLSSSDTFVEIAAIELLGYLCPNFTGSEIPEGLLCLEHPLPELLKREIESDWNCSGRGITTVGDLLRFDYTDDHGFMM